VVPGLRITAGSQAYVVHDAQTVMSGRCLTGGRIRSFHPVTLGRFPGHSAVFERPCRIKGAADSPRFLRGARRSRRTDGISSESQSSGYRTGAVPRVRSRVGTQMSSGALVKNLPARHARDERPGELVDNQLDEWRHTLVNHRTRISLDKM